MPNCTKHVEWTELVPKVNTATELLDAGGKANTAIEAEKNAALTQIRCLSPLRRATPGLAYHLPPWICTAITIAQSHRTRTRPSPHTPASPRSCVVRWGGKSIGIGGPCSCVGLCRT